MTNGSRLKSTVALFNRDGESGRISSI